MKTREANERELVGDVLTSWQGAKGDDEIVIKVQSGKTFRWRHYQDCCETVTVEDICGDPRDLMAGPILQAAKETSENETPKGLPNPDVSEWGSYTWTFYRLASAKGSVVVRWLGESNGYYSEEVDFEEVFL